MNPIVEEMRAILQGDELYHYGVARRSGRYPYGSGEDPYQHNTDFLGRIELLKKDGWNETAENVKKEFGISLKEYRYEKAIAREERRSLDVARAKSLAEDGLGPSAIGAKMGINESSVRSLLNSKSEKNMNAAKATADFLKKQVDDKKMIDVGVGVERELKISRTKLDEAIYRLEREGYVLHKGGIKQVTNAGNQTNQQVLCVPGTPWKDIYQHDKVKTITEYTSRDDGETFEKFQYPKSLDSKRIMVRPAEEGGTDKDGIIELRRGVDDLSLGDSHYAQVRILVDNKKYLKGVAVYSDNMPPGVDVIVNSNKSKSLPKLDHFKDIKDDPDNPFGSLIKAGGQSTYIDKNGKKQLSVINKRADEGDWGDWADALPSQFLGKQSLTMAKKQLDLAKADKLAEYDDICKINNPTIKKHLLKEFSDNCDAAAVHLKAAALPGQKYHVIIPVNTLKDNEVYAPNYENGTKLALIRYPHGGTFEIPVLTVNNKHRAARQLIGTDSIDAVGITKKVADRLSGADFDGDTVMCIPTDDAKGRVKITRTDELDGLKGFEPKDIYKERPGMKYMKDPVTGKDATQSEMGKISNLITDMTLLGADHKELARAVRHSMVVIDAGKHKLDYKQSEIDNDIASLKKKYQIGVDKNGKVKYGGASTILSRSSGEATVLRRQGTPKINIKGTPDYNPSKPEGSLIYKTADDLYYPVRTKDKTTGLITLTTNNGKKVTYDPSNKAEYDRYNPVKKKDPKTGAVIGYTNKAGDIEYKVKAKTQKSTRMAEVDDARELMSTKQYPMEKLYADYANSMKALANQARKELVSTGKLKYNKEAKAKYIDEVKSLDSKLNIALLNSPRERAAQRMANYIVDTKKAADPNMKKDDIKKASQQAISATRQDVGAIARKKRNIDITDSEWEAIQAGAISDTTLVKILANTDVDKLRERATPRQTSTLSKARINKAKRMQSSNYTLNEIAKALGCSTSTVSKYLKGVS